MLSVPVETQPTISVGTPTTLFQGRFPVRLSFWSDYDVSPDGTQFLMLEATEDSELQINVVTNWLGELKERVPVP